jgi:hypothetical protein
MIITTTSTTSSQFDAMRYVHEQSDSCRVLVCAACNASQHTTSTTKTKSQTLLSTNKVTAMMTYSRSPRKLSSTLIVTLSEPTNQTKRTMSDNKTQCDANKRTREVRARAQRRPTSAHATAQQHKKRLPPQSPMHNERGNITTHHQTDIAHSKTFSPFVRTTTKA